MERTWHSPDAPGRLGERLALRQMEAIDAQREQVQGRGSWRIAEPGTRFTLLDHPVHDGSRYKRLFVKAA